MFKHLALVSLAALAAAQMNVITQPVAGASIDTQSEAIVGQLSWNSYIQNFDYVAAYWTLSSTTPGNFSSNVVAQGPFNSSYVPPSGTPGGYVGAQNFTLAIPQGLAPGPYNFTAFTLGYVGNSNEPLFFNVTQAVTLTDNGSTGATIALTTTLPSATPTSGSSKQRRALKFAKAD